MPAPLAPHVAAALRYAKAVASGKLPAGQYVRAAAQRHLDDLARAKRSDWPYRFDREKAERFCRFAELLPHIKGALTGQRLKLEPWQCFIACVIFGWVKKSDGLRRFTEAYIRVPRKNGKSTFAAAIGLFMLSADGEPGAEVYSGATTEKQALEVFRPAWAMADKSPGFKAKFAIDQAGTIENPGSIYSARTGSRFLPLIGKPGDGASPHCAIHDEFHEHDTSEQYDAMDTGMGSRRQPLRLIVTTAGVNLAGPCFAKDAQCQKLLKGILENDRLFAIMYGLDEADDWTDFANWIKANPNYGVSLEPDYLKAQHAEALTNAGRQNILRTKHLDEWCNARTAWFNMAHWAKCEDTSLTRESVADLDLFIGLDLATKIDVASRVDLYVREVTVEDGPGRTKTQRHYFAFSRHYVPEARARDPKNTDYQAWARQGHLTVTSENEIDLGLIEREIRADATSEVAPVRLREVDYDPWRATQLAQNLAADGITAVEVRPLVKNFSPAMKELTAASASGRFHHDGNPVLTWMVSNVVAHEDAKGEVYPRKEINQPEQKIDGAVALLMAVSRAMVVEVGVAAQPAEPWNGVVEVW